MVAYLWASSKHRTRPHLNTILLLCLWSFISSCARCTLPGRLTCHEHAEFRICCHRRLSHARDHMVSWGAVDNDENCANVNRQIRQDRDILRRDFDDNSMSSLISALVANS